MTFRRAAAVSSPIWRTWSSNWSRPVGTPSRSTRRSGRATATTTDEPHAEQSPFEVVRHPTTLMIPEPSVALRMRQADHEQGHRHGVVRRRRAAGTAVTTGARCRRDAGDRQHARARGRLVDACHWRERRCGASETTPTSSRSSASTPGAGSPPRSVRPPRWNVSPPGSTPNGSSPIRWPGRELRARYGLGDRPVVVCVSRLVPRKGQDMLIRALPAIRQRVPGTALVIVGGGPYRDDLHRLARGFGVAEHVVFTDGVPADELPAHHAMADVFAMPCRTRGSGLDVEGLGIVYLEASATGVPVVAGNSGWRAGVGASTARRVWWSTAGTSARSPPPSVTCWPIPTAPRRWAGRADSGSSTTGSGAPRPSACPSC